MKEKGLILLAAFLLMVAAGRSARAGLFESAFFDVAMVQTSTESWGAIRYNRITGKAWVLDQSTWKPLADKPSPGNSLYRIVMAPLQKDWGAIRIDVISGETWECRDRVWIRISQPPS